MKNGTIINGDVTVTGNLNFSPDGVDKSCTISGSAWVSGNVTLGSKGYITGSLTWDGPTISPNPPGNQVGGALYPGGAMPALPPWVDFGYDPSVWVVGGVTYGVTTLSDPQNNCSWPTSTTIGGYGGDASAPVIIDALGCTGGISTTSNTTISLTSDVAIFTNQFNWGSPINSLTFTSSTTTKHNVWFITPDNVADGVPTCQNTSSFTGANLQGDFTINNGFTISPTLTAMLYTPCALVAKNGFTWNGQIYAGSYSYLLNNPNLTFSQSGLPGEDLNPPGDPVTYATSQPGTMISNRNYTG
jgi:hypothetical protein